MVFQVFFQFLLLSYILNNGNNYIHPSYIRAKFIYDEDKIISVFILIILKNHFILSHIYSLLKRFGFKAWRHIFPSSITSLLPWYFQKEPSDQQKYDDRF